MIKAECRKTMTFPVVFLIFCLCILNVILLYYSEIRNTSYVGEEGYRQQWQQVTDMLEDTAPENVYAQLQADYEESLLSSITDGNSLGTVFVKKRILKELESIIQYDDYLENIRLSSDTEQSFSRFQESETYFTKQNRKLTAAAYEKMSTVSVSAQPSLGIELFSTSSITNFIVLFLLMFLQIIIWGKDKETGMNGLLHTCYNGRKHLASAKTYTSFAGCVIVVLLMYGGSLLMAQKLYGTGDWNRSLSSVYLFRQTAWNIPVWQFVLLFLGYKILSSFLCMLLFGIAVDFFNSIINAIICCAGGMAVCWFVYENSSNVVKYLLPGGLLHTENLFEIYRNLNVFGFPLEYTRTASAVLIIGILGCICILTGNRTEPGKRVRDKLTELLHRCWPEKAVHPLKNPVCETVVLWFHELWKLFLTEKVLVLLVLLFVVQSFISPKDTVRYYNYTDFYYRQYMQYLSGEVTEEKREYLRQEKERFTRLQEQQEAAALRGETDYLAEQELNAYEAFKLAEQYTQYITKNDIGYMVYEAALEDLTAARTQRTDALLACEAMLFAVLCSALIFGRDYQLGADKFCGTMLYGKRKSPAIRMAAGMAINLLILLLVYVPFYAGTLRTYGVGTECLHFPAGCLRILNRYGNSITLGVYFLLLFIVRFLFMNAAGLLICAISQKLRSIINTIIAGCALFVLPFGMIMLNDALANLFPIYIPMLGNRLLTCPIVVIITVVLTMLALTVWLTGLRLNLAKGCVIIQFLKK